MIGGRLEARPWIKPTLGSWKMLTARTCWHFDAYAFLCFGGLRLVIETRRGGNRLIKRSVYAIRHDGTLWPMEDDAQAFGKVTLGELEPAFRGHLNAIHWRYVVPWSERVPSWARSRSVLCHYVTRDDRDAMAGLENYFRTGVDIL